MNHFKESPTRQPDSGAPKKKKPPVVAVIVLSAAALLIAGCIVALIVINMPSEDNRNVSATQNITAATTLSVPVTSAASGQTVPSTASETNNTLEPSANDSVESAAPTAPQTLAEAVEAVGLTLEDLPGKQIVVVDSINTSAIITFYEKKDNAWEQLEDMTVLSAYVGRQGVSEAVSEYAAYTPLGIYALGTCFGINENPGTVMPYFQVTPESYWVDDPDSAFYNRHVEGTENADWKSAEHLIDYQPSYNYAVEIRYNVDPAVPGKGSAFFMHVGSAPTAGCVAMPEENIIQLLRWLDSEKDPHIILK